MDLTAGRISPSGGRRGHAHSQSDITGLEDADVIVALLARIEALEERVTSLESA